MIPGNCDWCVAAWERSWLATIEQPGNILMGHFQEAGSSKHVFGSDTDLQFHQLQSV